MIIVSKYWLSIPQVKRVIKTVTSLICQMSLFYDKLDVSPKREYVDSLNKLRDFIRFNENYVSFMNQIYKYSSQERHVFLVNLYSLNMYKMNT